MLEGHEGDAYAGGHTHLPMVRHNRGAVIINPGSVGLPFMEPVMGSAPEVRAHAEYAILESTEEGLEVRLRRLELSPIELTAALTDSGCPMVEFLRAQYAT